VIAGVFAYLGTRLRAPVAPARPGKAATIFLVLIWVASLVAFLIDAISYGFVLKDANLVATYQSYTAPNPVSPITDLSALATFVITMALTRRLYPSVGLISGRRGPLAADWLARLGKEGFEALVDDIVEQSVDRGLRDRVEPRLASIENRLLAIEIRLDVADRLSKLEAEVSALKQRSN
jgi:hypothetical protein